MGPLRAALGRGMEGLPSLQPRPCSPSFTASLQHCPPGSSSGPWAPWVDCCVGRVCRVGPLEALTDRGLNGQVERGLLPRPRLGGCAGPRARRREARVSPPAGLRGGAGRPAAVVTRLSGVPLVFGGRSWLVCGLSTLGARGVTWPAPPTSAPLFLVAGPAEKEVTAH